MGLFRDFLSPPPWEEVRIEDIDDLTPERAQALAPLYRRMEPESELVECYRQVLAQWRDESRLLPDPLPAVLTAADSTTVQWRLDDFVEKLTLARSLGPERVERLAEAVFGYDEFSAASGTPDLFVWDLGRHPAEWFFAEVKGHRDHLQESQTTWLREHWDDIEGRFAVISIG